VAASHLPRRWISAVERGDLTALLAEEGQGDKVAIPPQWFPDRQSLLKVLLYLTSPRYWTVSSPDRPLDELNDRHPVPTESDR
jgi:hypothetical protein